MEPRLDLNFQHRNSSAYVVTTIHSFTLLSFDRMSKFSWVSLGPWRSKAPVHWSPHWPPETLRRRLQRHFPTSRYNQNVGYLDPDTGYRIVPLSAGIPRGVKMTPMRPDTHRRWCVIVCFGELRLDCVYIDRRRSRADAVCALRWQVCVLCKVRARRHLRRK